MADRNIFIGYDLGCGLAPRPGPLPAELEDPVRVAQFVDEIDCTLVVDRNRDEDWVRTGEHLREMAEKSGSVMAEIADPIMRVGMTLRLWAGCVWAAKPLDRPELTSAFRESISGRTSIRERTTILSSGLAWRLLPHSTRFPREVERRGRASTASRWTPRCVATSSHI
jgi:hypothetical protein